MRAFILTFALALPLALTGCAESEYEEAQDNNEALEDAVEDGAPPGDYEDVPGDGEIIDEPGEIEPDSPNDDFMEDSPID